MVLSSGSCTLWFGVSDFGRLEVESVGLRGCLHALLVDTVVEAIPIDGYNLGRVQSRRFDFSKLRIAVDLKPSTPEVSFRSSGPR